MQEACWEAAWWTQTIKTQTPPPPPSPPITPRILCSAKCMQEKKSSGSRKASYWRLYEWKQDQGCRRSRHCPNPCISTFGHFKFFMHLCPTSTRVPLEGLLIASNMGVLHIFLFQNNHNYLKRNTYLMFIIQLKIYDELYICRLQKKKKSILCQVWYLSLEENSGRHEGSDETNSQVIMEM